MSVTRSELTARQLLPLEFKIRYTEIKIQEWLDFCTRTGKTPCVSKSGMDSEVLLDIARSIRPDIVAVFVDTGQENATVVERNREIENIVTVRPEISFDQVVKRYGYPVISKRVSRYLADIQNPTGRNEKTRVLRLTGMRSDGAEGAKASRLPHCYHRLIDCGYRFSAQCCYFLKKRPLYRIQKEMGLMPMVGTLAEDSEDRAAAYLKTGCNAFSAGKSAPLSIWTRQDILAYAKARGLRYAACYREIVTVGDKLALTGESNTGCEGCLFGIKHDPTRIERVREWSPPRYRYYMETLDYQNLIPLLLGADQ